MDIIYKIDTYIFKLINISLSNYIFDLFMPIFHYTKYFIPIIILPWIITSILDKKNRWKLICLIPISIIFVDQTGLWIKQTIARPRPWVVMESDLINHLVSQKGHYLSFPSNHAANTAVMATIFSSIYYNFRYILWGSTIIIMFSRVYIGVHYPLDVLFGFILGLIFGKILLYLWNYFESYINLKKLS